MEYGPYNFDFTIATLAGEVGELFEFWYLFVRTIPQVGILTVLSEV